MRSRIEFSWVSIIRYLHIKSIICVVLFRFFFIFSWARAHTLLIRLFIVLFSFTGAFVLTARGGGGRLQVNGVNITKLKQLFDFDCIFFIEDYKITITKRKKNTAATTTYVHNRTHLYRNHELNVMVSVYPFVFTLWGSTACRGAFVLIFFFVCSFYCAAVHCIGKSMSNSELSANQIMNAHIFKWCEGKRREM